MVSNVTLKRDSTLYMARHGTAKGPNLYRIEQYLAHNLTKGRPHLVEVYNGTNVMIGPDHTLPTANCQLGLMDIASNSLH
mmetsp:Transcript_19135/g.44796  ORF Transcript_19135/g.44796 Transcript_19135/m.44796 type:complete len:80 (+) Transcript_19135:203-442(+)